MGTSALVGRREEIAAAHKFANRVGAAAFLAVFALIVWAAFSVLAGCAFGTGCEGGGCEPDPFCDTNCAPVPAAPAGAAVVSGLTAVDASAYGGWAGACPGSDLDANRFAALAASFGMPAQVLRNPQATRFRFISACAASAAALKQFAGRSPLLLIYYSGHGGQVPDVTGDEEDGADETLCLWDGQLADDLLWEALCRVPEGVRVAFITDSCNSASNYRAPKDWAAAMGARASRAPGKLKCAFFHIGGCGDGESSYGGADGGEATNALLAALRPGVLWEEWAAEAQKLMPRGQKLTWSSINWPAGTEAMR